MNPPAAASTTHIDSRDRLIFALDVATIEEARAWIERLGDAVTFYKVGLEFCMSGQYFELLAELRARGKKVFADLKFSDVPATVRAAVANLARHNVTCCTLHGTSAVYRAAVPMKGTMQLLAVTVLTSVDATEVEEMGWSGPVEDLVSRRARVAVECGIDGLICSALEAARLRRELGATPRIITPGIRATAEQGSDDQKRTMTLAEAFRAGADHVVVGRPIRQAADPRAAAEAMQAEIAALFDR
ncbi:MAG TPA: orotidine-5'-phosphate decarboxylase [Chthoniobacteraceae bacterium]|jgi:orotidine-5'-phosphate decarboxylase|nr:orotidine-5'-phosphate decarboxylase [Chthoniobacteraceae bacterium]